MSVILAIISFVVSIGSLYFAFNLVRKEDKTEKDNGTD